MVVPLALLGSPDGLPAIPHVPLFVAAGWGLYEIAASRRRGTAVALVLAGWVIAFPAWLLVMADPRLGPEEYPELEALADGGDGGDGSGSVTRPRSPAYLDANMIPKDGRSSSTVTGGPALAAQVRPAHLSGG